MKFITVSQSIINLSQVACVSIHRGMQNNIRMLTVCFAYPGEEITFNQPQDINKLLDALYLLGLEPIERGISDE